MEHKEELTSALTGIMLRVLTVYPDASVTISFGSYGEGDWGSDFIYANPSFIVLSFTLKRDGLHGRGAYYRAEQKIDRSSLHQMDDQEGYLNALADRFISDITWEFSRV
jgi:hypothetical protein